MEDINQTAWWHHLLLVMITFSDKLLLAISSDSAGEEEKCQLQNTEAEMAEESSSSLCFLRDASVINVYRELLPAPKCKKQEFTRSPQVFQLHVIL